MTGPELADEIEAWLARNPDVSKWRFSDALRGNRGCIRDIRRTRTIGQATIDKARKVMADKPASILKQGTGGGKPKKPSVTNTRRARSIKATNRRQALDNIAAGRPAKSAAIRITQREIERQMREAARLSDPLEQAKLALRRAGFVVYSLSIYGGPADVFHVSGRGREEVSANDLMKLAEQSGRWAA